MLGNILEKLSSVDLLEDFFHGTTPYYSNEGFLRFDLEESKGFKSLTSITRQATNKKALGLKVNSNEDFASIELHSADQNTSVTYTTNDPETGKPSWTIQHTSSSYDEPTSLSFESEEEASTALNTILETEPAVLRLIQTSRIAPVQLIRSTVS